MKNEFNFTPEDSTFDASDFLDGDSTALEFNIGDFNLTEDASPARTRYMKPTFSKKPVTVDYKNAQDLARSITLYPGEQIHALVKGDFIFGDFLEALLVEKGAKAKSAFISTLSMSQNNVDSLRTLLRIGAIGHLTLMISNYFYSHEKNNLIRYLLAELDIDNRLDLIVCRNHTKITLLEIANLRLVLSGSSNLRSSQSIEQFILQDSPELFAFYKSFFTDHASHDIIKKDTRRETDGKPTNRKGSAQDSKRH